MFRPKRWVFYFLLFLFFSIGTVVAFKGISSSQSISLQPQPSAVPASLFGIHILRPRVTSPVPWPSIPLFTSWRLWDAFVAWPNLEPRKGEWHFEILDKYLELTEKNQVEIVLPFSLSPTWASARPTEKSAYSRGFAAEPQNIEDWRNYVRTVATRYKGRIRYYELWNEPNYKNFYTGTVEQMVALARETYQILKQVDPSVKVISPSATTYVDENASWLEEYFAKGGGAYADVIGYHFYVRGKKSPEAMLPSIRKVQQVMTKYGFGDKPLWNTEAGWSRKSLASDEQEAAYLARAYILNWAAGIPRFYWYGIYMIEADGKTLRPAAIAYAKVRQWLVGNRITNCTQNQNTWTCHLTRDGGYNAWIVWNSERQLRFQVPDTWKVQQVQDLTGNKRNLPAQRTVEIGQSPLLFEK